MAQDFTVNRWLTTTDVNTDGALEAAGQSAQDEARDMAVQLGVTAPAIGDPERIDLADGGALLTVRFTA